MNKPEIRVDKIVSDLLRGRRLRLRGGDAEEKAAITAAARLVAARQGSQRMNPAFRKRLESSLEAAPQEPWLTRRAALVAGRADREGDGAGLSTQAWSARASRRRVDQSETRALDRRRRPGRPCRGAGQTGHRRRRRCVSFSARRLGQCRFLHLLAPALRAVVEQWRRHAELLLPSSLVHAGGRIYERQISASGAERGPGESHCCRQGRGARNCLR